MTNVISALTARTQLGQIIKRATQNNERFVVDRRGQASVVIMSVKDYANTFAPAPAELRAMQQQAKKAGTSKLSMRQIDRLIADVRTGKTTPKTSKRPRK